MATGLRQSPPCRKNARAFHHVGACGFCQIPITTTRVTHRGEAAHQHALHDGQCTQCGKHIGLVGGDVEVQVRRNHVHVTINQTWHQGFALGLHHFRAVSNEHVCLMGEHRLDQAILDPDVLVGDQGQRGHIQDIGRLKQDGAHRTFTQTIENHIKTQNNAVCRPRH